MLFCIGGNAGASLRSKHPALQARSFNVQSELPQMPAFAKRIGPVRFSTGPVLFSRSRFFGAAFPSPISKRLHPVSDRIVPEAIEAL